MKQMTQHGVTELRPEIDAVLARLRARIRRYVLIEGLGLVVVLLGTLFWVSLLVDWTYFQASHWELPRWFRGLFLISAVCIVAGGAIAWIALRLMRSFRRRALALVLERRFPELDDRLITVVEAAEEPASGVSPLTASMLDRTVSDVTRTVRHLELGSVFDRRPLRRALIVAAVLVVSILVFAVTNAGATRRWYDGYIALRDNYWNRETELVVKVLVQPGDRVREFREYGYRHPRGSDLMLLVEVPEGKKVPDTVRLDYRLGGGRGGGRTYLSQVGDQPFQHTIPGLLEDAEIWATGNDFTNARPYRVEVVDPPRVDHLVLESRYPEYTGLNQRDSTGQVVPTENAVQGAQIALPMETQFILRAEANKPLVRVRIEGDIGPDRWELEFGTSPRTAVRGLLTLKSQDARPRQRVELPAAIAARMLSEDGRHFAVPFVLTAHAAEQLPERIAAAAESNQPFALPVPLPSDTVLRISLEDTDDILGPDPSRLTINGIADRPPSVETELQGISSSITRKATIPVAGLITDDYGVAAARFQYRVEGGERPAESNGDFQPRELAVPVAGSPKSVTLGSEMEPVERFDVLPLDLSVRQKLVLTVQAEDGDNLNGPHSTQGQRSVFTVVPNEELLSLLYAKELNLRRRFEQILTELKQTRQDLTLRRSRWDEAATRQLTADSPEARESQIAVGTSADRALHGVRKNATETSSIEEAFGDIRAELVNNRVDTPQMLDRIDNRIVAPLHRINTGDYTELDQTLGLFKLATEKGRDPREPLTEAIDRLGTLIERMEQVLLEMRKLETFQEALELLKAIIGDEQKLMDETQAKRKSKLIDLLE